MLVEALVSMGILVVAVFAIFSMLTRSTSLNRVISQQYVATYLAAEGLEVVSNIVDSNLLTCTAPWNDNATDGTYELTYGSNQLSTRVSGPTSLLRVSPTNGFYQYQSGDPSLFRRAVTIKTIKGDVEMRVTSVVTWKGRGGVDSEVKLEDHFFKWRPRPAGC